MQIVLYRNHRQEDERKKLEIATDLFEGDRGAARAWLSTPATRRMPQ